MIQTEDFEQVEVSSVEQFWDWLRLNHQQTQSVWLVTFKKHVSGKYLSTSDVLDVLLCFGWTDGLRRKLDEDRTMQLISPRRVDHWTATYKTRAARLIEEGRMQPPGYASIQRAKAKGLWNAMEDVDNLELPADLQKALSAKPEAADFFAAINPSSKRFVLRWLKLAKTDKTRQRRITELVELSARGEKLKGS